MAGRSEMAGMMKDDFRVKRSKCVLDVLYLQHPYNLWMISWLFEWQQLIFSHILLYDLLESDIQEPHQNNWNELRGGGHREKIRQVDTTLQSWRAPETVFHQGRIDWKEFMDGATRLKGQAKSMDTCLEVQGFWGALMVSQKSDLQKWRPKSSNSQWYKCSTWATNGKLWKTHTYQPFLCWFHF